MSTERTEREFDDRLRELRRDDAVVEALQAIAESLASIRTALAGIEETLELIRTEG